MAIVIFSDPHIGLKRTANTTRESSVRLRDRLYHSVKSVMSVNRGSKFICCGDLFDTYSNSEDIIFQGSDIVNQCEVVLSGNHDVINREDVMGSLELIASSGGTGIQLYPFGEYGATCQMVEGHMVVSVPHMANQGLFDASLKDAVGLAESQWNPSTMRSAILLLHCNYNLGFAENDTALNLTNVQARFLLETFHNIFIGHDHHPKDDFNGRLQVVGNLHPTGFGDVSDKRYLVLHDDGRVESRTVWSKSQKYLECDWKEVPRETTATFVRITGRATANDMKDISKSIATLWRENSEMLAVRMDVDVKSIDIEWDVRNEVTSLPEVIAKELGDSPEGLLWKELVA